MDDQRHWLLKTGSGHFYSAPSQQVAAGHSFPSSLTSLPFSSFIFPSCHFYYSLLYCAAQTSALYVRTKSAPPFCLPGLSALSLMYHYPSIPTLSPASSPRPLTFSSQPPSCGHSSSFVRIICRFPIPWLFLLRLSLCATLLLPSLS